MKACVFLWLYLGLVQARLLPRLEGQHLHVEYKGSMREKDDEDILRRGREEEEEDLAPDEDGPLLGDDGRLSYAKLAGCTSGRHLLLISLLQAPLTSSWKPRCQGHLQLFLPHSLRSRDQPPAPSDCQMLREIASPDGGVLTRAEVEEDFKQQKGNLGIISAAVNLESSFSSNQSALVRLVVEMVAKQENFHSAFSYLVTIKDLITVNVFVRIVYIVIHQRKDVGHVVPSPVTIMPQDYFPAKLLDIVREVEQDEEYYESSRSTAESKRNTERYEAAAVNEQAAEDNFEDTMREADASDGVARSKRQAIAWRAPRERVLRWNPVGSSNTTSWPEAALWYWREDPEVNANHYYWHMAPGADTWMARRGEMFYFMHKQVLARYNCERVCHGLELVLSYGPEEWGRPVVEDYSPMLGATYGRRWRGAVMSWRGAAQLRGWLAQLRAALRWRQLRLSGRIVNMVYRNGVDEGISALGDAVEAVASARQTYGNLHNMGHTHIADMNQAGGEAAIGKHETAFRDPVFFRWHKFIDDVFMEYKRSLGPYSDQDLSFPGVSVSFLELQTDGVPVANTAFTFTDHTASVRLGGLDFPGRPGTGVRVLYSRLAHMAFTVSLEVRAARAGRAFVRLFLLPAGVVVPRHTDITQVTIELDRFNVDLVPGSNSVQRRDSDSSFLSHRRPDLLSLQQQLLQGQLSRDQLNWAGCGWPEELHLPRGSQQGTPFRLVAMVTPVLAQDTRPEEGSTWSLCGVRGGGRFPDSRPMGFPFDRPPPGMDWRRLMERGGERRSNWAVVDVMIEHDPEGVQ